jgi:hypothetical protein
MPSVGILQRDADGAHGFEGKRLPTGDAKIPFLVSAPTMRVSGDVSETVNVCLAFRAALIVVLAHNRSSDNPIRTVLCRGDSQGPDARRILRQHRDLLA